MQGEDEEETTMFHVMLAEAKEYLQTYHWCPPIQEEYLGFGIGKVRAVFLFRFARAINDTDEFLWVVVGDLPSAYFVVDEAPDAKSAAKVYCQIVQEWVDAVLKKTPLARLLHFY